MADLFISLNLYAGVGEVDGFGHGRALVERHHVYSHCYPNGEGFTDADSHADTHPNPECAAIF